MSAAERIATIGYEQTSLGDIAAELDLTRPALYHYFATKQEIFTEIALTAIQGIYVYVSAAVEASRAQGDSSGEQLRVFMIGHAEYFESNYWMINATIAGYGGISRQELGHIEEIEKGRDDYRDLLHEILRNGFDNGEFQTGDTDAVGRSIFQLLNITRWYRPGGEKNALDIALENFELVMGGLALR